MRADMGQRSFRPTVRLPRATMQPCKMFSTSSRQHCLPLRWPYHRAPKDCRPASLQVQGRTIVGQRVYKVQVERWRLCPDTMSCAAHQTHQRQTENGSSHQSAGASPRHRHRHRHRLRQPAKRLRKNTARIRHGKKRERGETRS